MTTVKESQTRMKPLALASGHGRHVAVTPEWALFSVGEWPSHVAVVNLKPLHFRNGFETAVSEVKPPLGSRDPEAP
jgi:hypothetical protein